MRVRLDPAAWIAPLVVGAAGGALAAATAGRPLALAAGAVAIVAALVALERASRWLTGRLEVTPLGLTVFSGRLRPRRDTWATSSVRAVALEPQSALDLLRGRGTLVLFHGGGRERFGPVRRARRVRREIEERLGLPG